jgi:hypothetical protein
MRFAELSTKKRNNLDEDTFAFPDQRKMPLNDAAHVRAALSRFNQVTDVSADDKSAAKARIKRAARKFGVDVSDDFTEWGRYAEPLMMAGPYLAFGEKQDVQAGEVIDLPYVSVGEWNFRDYVGEVAVRPADLDTIVGNFHNDARRQDLPLLVNEEHEVPPEGVDLSTYIGPGAIGWIKDLYKADESLVRMKVELNALGEKLYREDRFRGVSPELIRRWIDPETDEDWGMTAAGAAFSTMPRMKGLASRQPMAAGEVFGRPRALAFAEQFTEIADVHADTATNIVAKGDSKDAKASNLSVAYAFPEQSKLPLNSKAGVKGAVARFRTIIATTQERNKAWERIRDAAVKYNLSVPEFWKQLSLSECARWLMDEGDADSELAELPICIYQPPYAAVGVCPGWTRNDDNDKDTDVCLMALRGCNGYVPCPTDQLHGAVSNQFGSGDDKTAWASPAIPDSAGYYSEGGSVTPEEKAAKEAADKAKATATTTATSTPVTPTPDAALNAANMAEINTILNTERAGRLKAEETAQAALKMAEEARKALSDRDAADKLAKASTALETLVRSGQITPAESEVYTKEIATFAEHPFMLEALKTRPKPIIQMKEVGAGGERPQGSSDTDAIDVMAKALMSERKQETSPRAKGYYENYRQALLDVSRQGFQGGQV